MKTYFDEIAANWDSICPYLINDDNGQKTKHIRKNCGNVAERCDEMLTVFLSEIRNPTWRFVLEVLRKRKHEPLADKIERELQEGVIAK